MRTSSHLRDSSPDLSLEVPSQRKPRRCQPGTNPEDPSTCLTQPTRKSKALLQSIANLRDWIKELYEDTAKYERRRLPGVECDRANTGLVGLYRGYGHQSGHRNYRRPLRSRLATAGGARRRLSLSRDQWNKLTNEGGRPSDRPTCLSNTRFIAPCHAGGDGSGSNWHIIWMKRIIRERESRLEQVISGTGCRFISVGLGQTGTRVSPGVGDR